MAPGPALLRDEPNEYYGGHDHINDPIYPWLNDAAPPIPTTPIDSDAPDIPIPRPNFELHDIKIEYHPTSGRPTTIISFDDYAGRDHFPDPIPLDTHPWAPFQSRLDFEIAELSLEAALNHSQLNRLIKLVHSAGKKDPDNSFNIKSAGDMKKMWEEASHLRTAVSLITIDSLNNIMATVANIA